VDFSGWRILHTRHKSLCANSNTQGHIYATLGIVKENDLKPEDIASVVIKAGLRESRHTVTFSKKYPRNGESADHSAFYANAIAIKERHFGPEAFKPEKYSDPVVLDLIEKMTVLHEPSIPDDGIAGISEITTKDGRRFHKRVEVPHGLGDDPFSDEELEAKFFDMATKYMRKDQAQKLRDTVWGVEKLDDIHKLTELMVFSGK
jgi:2-methylcitrate dehydratase